MFQKGMHDSNFGRLRYRNKIQTHSETTTIRTHTNLCSHSYAAART
jgi:hypothetical protein